MTLRISLRDGEKIIINGAVLRSKGRTNLSIESKAAILRGRDLIDAGDAISPATRLYHACISAYTDPENSGIHQDSIVSALTEVMATLQQPVAIAAATSFARLVAISDYYRALADCRSLITIERSAAPPPTLRLVHSNDAQLLPA